MNKQARLLAILAVVASSWLLAGEVNGQSVVRMPVQKASWKVTIKHRDAPQTSPSLNPADPLSRPPERIAKSISVDLAPPLRRDVIEWSDNSKSEVWRIGNLWLVETPEGVLVINHLGFGANYGDWHSFDESYFAWATEKNSKSIEDFKGRPALFCEGALPMASVAMVKSPDTPADDTVSKAEAWRNKLWVDAETHLPMVLEEGLATYVFKFDDAPPAPLQVPVKFQKEYRRFTSLSQVPPPYRRSVERHK